MRTQLSDRILHMQVTTLDVLRTTGSAVRRRLTRGIRDQSGQTPTEYLMIVGLMAAAIVTIFVTFFWGTIKGSASAWAAKVKEAVDGGAMK